MLRTYSALLILVFLNVYIESLPANSSAELISTYAKVAHWGATGSSPSPSEGRSSGQTLWTHRSDVNIRGGQNLAKKQPVAYYYSMRAPSSKVDEAKLETIPSKGEVQERFNPRPYFDFVFDDPPRSNRRPDPQKTDSKQGQGSSKIQAPALVYGTPADTFSGGSQLASDTYNSPFSSYNPPNNKPSDSGENAASPLDFPPNDGQPQLPPPPLYDNPNDDKRQPLPPETSYGAPNDKPPPSPSAMYGSPGKIASPPGPPSGLYDTPPPDIYGAPLAPPADTYGSPENKAPKDSSNPPSGLYGAPPADLYGPHLGKPPKDSSKHPPLDVYGGPSDIYGPPDSKPPNDSDKPEGDNKPHSNGKYPNGYSFHPPLAAPPSMDESFPPDSNGGDSDGSYYAPPPAPNGNGGHPHFSSDDSHYAPYAPSPNGMDSGNGMDMSNGMGNGHGGRPYPPPPMDYGPPISQTVQPPDSADSSYLEQPPASHDYHHHPHPVPSMAEDDLSPPPAAVPHGKIPHYLDHEPSDHDFYHFGHHDVYHEVHHPTTTTTTEAPRASHYSYYYLGRKLWFIPLYFSVYFILYVTALILKSIARHKIQFSHNFDRARSSRELDLSNTNKTVVNAIQTVEKKYM